MEDISESVYYEEEIVIENCKLNIKIEVEDPLDLDNNIPLLTCEQCDFMTTSSVDFEGHNQSHEECYSMCTKCDFVTRSVLLLNQHLKLHTDVNKCERCEFSCELEDDMKVHTDVHHQTPWMTSIISTGNHEANANEESSFNSQQSFENSSKNVQEKNINVTPKKITIKEEIVTPKKSAKKCEAKINSVKKESVSPQVLKVGQKRGNQVENVSPNTSLPKHGKLEDSLEIYDVAELPEAQGLETALDPKRKRRLSFLEKGIGNPEPQSPSKPSIQKALSTRKDREVLDNFGSEGESDEEEDCDEFEMPSQIRAYRSEFYADIEDEQPTPDNVTATASNTIVTDTLRPHDLYDFEWRTFSDTPISPTMRREKFSSKQGPTAPNADPYSNFISIWDRQIMEHIASETNAYAQEVAATMADNGILGPRSRICSWKDVTVDELYTLWAIFLAMGMVIKGSINEYWSASTDIFITPGFMAYMSLKRFQLLCSCLHFSRNGRMPPGLDPGQAKLYKIQPIISHLNDKFQNLYHLSQNIALDESLLQWSGWLNIKQFIPNKAAKVGIKSYEVCESQTGYLWRFEIHSLKTIQPPVTDPMHATTPAIVLRLIQGLEHKGHTLWMDNYYNSPALARKLKTLGTDCVGTLRTNRQFVPNSVKNLTRENMRPGQIAAITSGDVDLLVWRDRNRVVTISTYHGNAVTRASSGSQKPIVIHDYNLMMGGVDKKDQLLSAFPMERKRTKIWYKKLFKHLLNVSVLNSHIISKKSGSTLTHRAFRHQLIRDILDKHAPNSQPIDTPIITFPITFDVREHHIGYNPPRGNGSGRLRRTCVECGSTCATHCVGCNKPMCASACFAAAHDSRKPVSRRAERYNITKNKSRRVVT